MAEKTKDGNSRHHSRQPKGNGGIGGNARTPSPNPTPEPVPPAGLALGGRLSAPPARHGDLITETRGSKPTPTSRHNRARSLRTHLETNPPRPLATSEVLQTDLTTCPPRDFPSLTVKQARMITERARDPLASWEAIYERAGIKDGRAELRTTPRVRVYLAALAWGTHENTPDATDQRAAILARLAREAASAPEARDAALCAKVWFEQVRPAAAEREDLARMSAPMLERRLLEQVGIAGDHDEAIDRALRRLARMGCGEDPLPWGGNGQGKAASGPTGPDPGADEPAECGPEGGGADLRPGAGVEPPKPVSDIALLPASNSSAGGDS